MPPTPPVAPPDETAPEPLAPDAPPPAPPEPPLMPPTPPVAPPDEAPEASLAELPACPPVESPPSSSLPEHAPSPSPNHAPSTQQTFPRTSFSPDQRPRQARWHPATRHADSTRPASAAHEGAAEACIALSRGVWAALHEPRRQSRRKCPPRPSPRAPWQRARLLLCWVSTMRVRLASKTGPSHAPSHSVRTGQRGVRPPEGECRVKLSPDSQAPAPTNHRTSS